MALIFGKNEAHDRLMAELHDTNAKKVEYPSGTNMRGNGGREHHAMGDLVGNRSEPGIKKEPGMFVGDRDQKGEGMSGHKMKHAMRHGGRMRHAEGDSVEPLRKLRERFKHADGDIVRQERKLKRGGRACHANGDVVPIDQEQPGETRAKHMKGDSVKEMPKDEMRKGGRMRHAAGDGVEMPAMTKRSKAAM